MHRSNFDITLYNTCTACTRAPQQLLVLLPLVALVPALAYYVKEVEAGFGRLGSVEGFFKNGYLLQTGFFQAKSHAAH